MLFQFFFKIHAQHSSFELSLMIINSFPVEWLANELSHNPTVIEAILRRFVDVNRDGLLTTAEMLQQRPTAANNAGANGPATHQSTLSGDLTDAY